MTATNMCSNFGDFSNSPVCFMTAIRQSTGQQVLNTFFTF